MCLKNKIFFLLLGSVWLGGCSTGFLGLAPAGDKKEYVHARTLYNEHKYQEAVTELTGDIYKAGNVKRREARAYRLLGRSYEQLDQLSKALETYLEALEFHPKNIPLLLSAAQLYQHTGLIDKSQQLYDRVLAEEPNNLDALAGQAENYRTIGFFSRARTYYDQFFALNPAAAPLYRARYATTFLRQANYEQAFIHITMALAEDPSQPDYWLISAKAAFALGYLQDALEDVDTALLLAPDRTDLQLYKIIALYQAGEHKSSLQEAQKFLQKHPQEPLGLLLAALNEEKLGYYQRARQHLKQASQQDEKSFVGRVASQLLIEWK